MDIDWVSDANRTAFNATYIERNEKARLASQTDMLSSARIAMFHDQTAAMKSAIKTVLVKARLAGKLKVSDSEVEGYYDSKYFHDGVNNKYQAIRINVSRNSSIDIYEYIVYAYRFEIKEPKGKARLNIFLTLKQSSGTFQPAIYVLGEEYMVHYLETAIREWLFQTYLQEYKLVP